MILIYPVADAPGFSIALFLHQRIIIGMDFNSPAGNLLPPAGQLL
jgi:hypothetical protein